jgi:hypothetical protein
MVRVISLLAFLIFMGASSYAQRYYGVSKEQFGKSKIQSKEFQWRNFSSVNFEYNFYRGGEQTARNAANYLEKTHGRITDILGYFPYEPVKIFVFNSVADINSTNLGGANAEIENGTLIDVKNGRILTAYNKNDSLFNKQLVNNVASIYVYEMLYGGNVRESLESQILLNLPEWFSAGIAAYIAEEDNSERFQDFKSAISAAQSQKLSGLKGEEALLVGQSIWHYISLKYGKNNISNILNLTRIIHDEQSSITSTLGISFSRFLKEWKDFYLSGAPLREEPKEVVPAAKVEISPRITNLKPGEVDTDNYVFDEVNIKRYNEQMALPEASRVAGDRRIDGGRLGQDAKFSSVKLFKNFLISNNRKVDVLIDPVRHFGLGYSAGFTDLLKNNVFDFNAFVRPSAPLFRSFDFDLSYGNYAKKIDYVFKYEKRSINLESIDSRDAFLFRPLNHIVASDRPEYLYRRLISQRLSAKIIYPISNQLKLEVTPAIVKNDDRDYALNVREGIPSDFYFAPNASLVFDNSKVNKFGVQSGTKAKFSFDRYFHTSNNLKGFHSYYLDVRHYQKLVKGLQVVGRLSYGVSQGNSPQYTFLGGVENGVNRSSYQTDLLLSGGSSDLKNILFYNFPGNLRGYDFGRLYGNNHLLGNVELRTHLAEFMPQMALSSSFIRNFQVVGFFDIGTAWIGDAGPFSRQNSLNTTTSINGPFVIEVTNFKNPFLSGLGGGVRSSILGIFIRADYAVGLEDGEFNKPKLHISIGKDF